MAGILDLVAELPRRRCEPAEVILEQGAPASVLLVLIEGEVEVLRDEVRVARSSEPGAVFGEMSVLMGGPCTATVRAVKPSTFAVVVEPTARPCQPAPEGGVIEIALPDGAQVTVRGAVDAKGLRTVLSALRP